MITPADITFVKFDALPDDPCAMQPIGAYYYGIYVKGLKLGYVWREECFWYRGTQGINRGVRIRDYYPLEWKAGLRPYDAGGSRLSYKTRREATQRFLEDIMANVGGHVIKDGKIVGEFEYQGSGSRALSPIYPDENWSVRTGLERECRCGQPAVDVILWSEYGGGFHWPAKACLTCQCITDGFSDEDSEDGHPLGEEYETEWARLCNGKDV